jgi:hypothetical protein
MVVFEKTKGKMEYWFYFVRLKKLEGWSFNNDRGIKHESFITKGNKKMNYAEFSEILETYYRESAILLIRGHTLRFDYGIGNLRVIKTDKTVEQSLVNKANCMMSKNYVECFFYFSKDSVDFNRRRANNITLDKSNRFRLFIARSNEDRDKSLGLLFKLKESIRVNPELLNLYDIKFYNRDKDFL